MAAYFEKQHSSRNGTTQIISNAASSVAVSNAFGAQTYQIRVVSTVAVNYTTDAAPTATTSHPLLPANFVEYVTVTPGQKLATIGSSGTTYVTELS